MHGKLYWATLLFRASRSGDVRRARKATEAWPDLLRWCGGDGEVVDRQGLSSCISNLQCDALDEEARGLDGCDADDDQSKARKLLVNHERRKLWGLKRKRFATCGIVGDSGQPFSSTAEEAEELRRFRQGSFESSDTDGATAGISALHTASACRHRVARLAGGFPCTCIDQEGHSARARWPTIWCIQLCRSGRGEGCVCSSGTCCQERGPSCRLP